MNWKKKKKPWTSKRCSYQGHPCVKADPQFFLEVLYHFLFIFFPMVNVAVSYAFVFINTLPSFIHMTHAHLFFLVRLVSSCETCTFMSLKHIMTWNRIYTLQVLFYVLSLSIDFLFFFNFCYKLVISVYAC